MRNDECRARQNSGLVETMMTADSLQLTAYGPDEDEMRIAKDLLKVRTTCGLRLTGLAWMM